jgi:NADH-quinone oxidoreductase subunit E
MQTFDARPILARYPRKEENLIEILHDIQLAFRHLPRMALVEVAEHVGVPLARVMSVATFYKAFSLTPKGDRTLRICLGTACHVKGAALIREEAERKLGVRPGQTTADGKFTLEVVNCVGACAMAPVVIDGRMQDGQLKEQYHGKFKAVQLDALLRQGEK